MARVFIPTLLRAFTGGQAEVEATGGTVQEVLDQLSKTYPELMGLLTENARLRPNISVAVDGEVCPMGLLEEVSPTSEVHFITAIKGGR